MSQKKVFYGNTHAIFTKKVYSQKSKENSWSLLADVVSHGLPIKLWLKLTYQHLIKLEQFSFKNLSLLMNQFTIVKKSVFMWLEEQMAVGLTGGFISWNREK